MWKSSLSPKTGQTSQKGEQNDKSWQKMLTKSSEQLMRKVRKVIQPGEKGQQNISNFKRVQPISIGGHLAQRMEIFHTCACAVVTWKISVQLPLCWNFGALDLLMRLAGAMDGLFQSGNQTDFPMYKYSSIVICRIVLFAWFKARIANIRFN